MAVTIRECDRRRKIQQKFNTDNSITPSSVQKAIKVGIEAWADAEEFVRGIAGQDREAYELGQEVADLERQMELAARNLEFEKAARIRDRLQALKGDDIKIPQKSRGRRKSG